MIRITRGTTPTILVEMPDSLDLSTLTQIWFTIAQGKVKFNITKDEMEIEDQVVSVPLTQEQTLSLLPNFPRSNKLPMLDPDKECFAQMRCLTSDGAAFASRQEVVAVEDVLREGVIE